jgi:hypothetical protein
MSSEMTKEQLRQALSGDFERLLDKVVEAMNKAQPGHIIDDSEEPVRDATGQFRQTVFAKAVELRSQREAFSTCGQSSRPGPYVEEQRDTDNPCDYRQRLDPDSSSGLLG